MRQYNYFVVKTISVFTPSSEKNKNRNSFNNKNNNTRFKNS